MRICRGCGGHEECSCEEEKFVDALNKKMDLVEKLLVYGGIRANLRGADLSDTDLSRTDLYCANLGGANLSGANLSGADLSETDLSGALLCGADLRGSDLRRADLGNADLIGANLVGADLSDADLSGADLSGTNLLGALLCRADLQGSDLRGADLGGADLRGANLCGADLMAADLYGAKINNTILDPTNTPTADLSAFKIIKTRNNSNWVVAYRTAKSIHAGITEYLPGKIYEAHAFSTCSKTTCHPGIYFWPTWDEAIDRSARYYSCMSIVKILVRPYEIQQAGGKYRARWILVNEVVSLAGRALKESEL